MSLERELAVYLARAHPIDAAEALEDAGDDVAVEVLLALDVDPAHRVLACMTPHRAASVLAQLPDPRAIAVVEAAPMTAAAWLMRRLPQDRRTTVLSALAPSRAKAISRALTAREGTAGAMVDPGVLALRPTMTVREALERHKDALVGASDAVPVVDDAHRLVGMVALDVLTSAAGANPIASLAKPAPAVLRDHLDRRAIVAHPGWLEASALPVVDSDGVLLGMLPYQDFRALEKALRGGQRPPAQTTSRALGQLYGMAVGGFLEALVSLSEGNARR